MNRSTQASSTHSFTERLSYLREKCNTFDSVIPTRLNRTPLCAGRHDPARRHRFRLRRCSRVRSPSGCEGGLSRLPASGPRSGTGGRTRHPHTGRFHRVSFSNSYLIPIIDAMPALSHREFRLTRMIEIRFLPNFGCGEETHYFVVRFVKPFLFFPCYTDKPVVPTRVGVLVSWAPPNHLEATQLCSPFSSRVFEGREFYDDRFLLDHPRFCSTRTLPCSAQSARLIVPNPA